MPPSSVAQRCPSRFINLRNDTPWARIENTIAYRSLPRASCTPCRQAGTGQARWRRRRAVRLIGARSLSDLGLIYRAGGRAAHSSPISRSIAPLCASKSANSVLALPPCSLRSPKSDRLLEPELPSRGGLSAGWTGSAGGVDEQRAGASGAQGTPVAGPSDTPSDIQESPFGGGPVDARVGH
jgi:hypothetical protein